VSASVLRTLTDRMVEQAPEAARSVLAPSAQAPSEAWLSSGRLPRPDDVSSSDAGALSEQFIRRRGDGTARTVDMTQQARASQQLARDLASRMLLDPAVDGILGAPAPAPVVPPVLLPPPGFAPARESASPSEHERALSDTEVAKVFSLPSAGLLLPPPPPPGCLGWPDLEEQKPSSSLSAQPPPPIGMAAAPSFTPSVGCSSATATTTQRQERLERARRSSKGLLRPIVPTVTTDEHSAPTSARSETSSGGAPASSVAQMPPVAPSGGTGKLPRESWSGAPDAPASSDTQGGPSSEAAATPQRGIRLQPSGDQVAPRDMASMKIFRI